MLLTFFSNCCRFNGATSSRTWKHNFGYQNACARALQWSHVLTNVETKAMAINYEAAKSSFNGATSSRTCKPERSQEPPTSLTVLQWSHVLTNVETLNQPGLHRGPDFASMEPRPHERGNWHPLGAKENGGCCFNGATSSRTWKRGFRFAEPQASRPLQWSHVLTNVETRHP